MPTSQQHILIIETAPSLASTLVESLEGLGLFATTAHSAEEGLTLARTLRPQLILLDIAMDGPAVCRYLKACDETSDIPVIFMTQPDEYHALFAGLEAGGIDFVCKPLRISEVVTRLSVRLKEHVTRPPINISKESYPLQCETSTKQSVFCNTPRCEEIMRRELAEDRLSQFTANAPGFFYTITFQPDGNFEMPFASLGMVDLLGIHPEKSTENFSLLIATTHPDDTEKMLAAFEESARSRSPYHAEFRIIHPTKGERWVEARSLPQHDADNRINWHGFMHDISERKHMQTQLMTQEQELRTLIENAPDNIIRYDTEMCIQYINPPLARILTRPLEQILGKRADEQIEGFHPAMQGYTAILKRVLETGQPEEYLLEMEVGHYSRAVYDHVRFAPEFSPTGHVVGVIAISRDFTRQQQLELELARRAREFRTLAENSPDLIVRYDRECRRIYANRAYLQTVNTAATNILNKTPQEIWSFKTPSAQDYMALLKRIFKSGRMEAIQAHRLDEQLQSSYLAMYLVPEFDHDGKIASVLTISRDITDLKQAEQRLEDSRAQLRALTAQREETREDERKHVAREIHDELGQRLTALRMDISRLRLRFGSNNPELLEQTREMVAAVDSTIQVVRDVAARIRPAVLDMGIVSALDWLTNDFNTRSGIECNLHFPHPEVILDNHQSTAVFRIVQESLTNVVRHSQATKVTITLKPEDSGYLLEIRDNGKGFDPDMAHKPESFGLIGIEERTLMLGGQLIIDTQPGRGVTLKVRLYH